MTTDYIDPDYYEERDCWNCGGEGYVADCFNGFCVNAEDGCALMRRCEYCNVAAPEAALTRARGVQQ